MSNGRIVVMGGNGFIGSEICRLAVETRYEVVSLSRSHNHPRIGAWTRAVDWVKVDLRDADDWRAYFKGTDAVIDCQSYGHVREDSTKLISGIAAQMHVSRFVYIGLSRVYPASKQQAEDFIAHTNLRWAALRPAFVYGWGRPWSVVPGRSLRTLSQWPGLRDLLRDVSPSRVDVVAAAALRAAVEPNVAGLLGVPEIERLGASRLREWQPGAMPQPA